MVSLQRFRFHVEEISRNVTVFTLTPDECRTFVNRYNQLRVEEPSLGFQTYALDGLIEDFEDSVLPLLEKSVNSDPFRMENVLDGLFSVCMTMNPMLNFMALEIVLPDFTATDDPLPARTPEPEPVEIDLSLLKPKVRGMHEILRERLVGQEEACWTVSQAFKRSAVGIGDPRKPVCSFIFAGCSGVGKTLMAKEVNEYLYPGQPLIRIDCSEYQQEHEYAKLIGCFVPGSQVSLPGGEQKFIEEIKPGEEVVTRSGSISTVQEVYEYESQDDLVFIKLYGDPRPMMCTPQHELLIWDDQVQSGIWTPAHEVHEGDWAYFPHGGYEVQESSEPPALWELLGWYLARGKLVPSLDKTYISFWSKEVDCRRRVLSLVSELYDLEDVTLSLAEDDVVVLGLSHHDFATFMGMATRQDGTRWIPPWLIEQMSRREALSLLAGLFCLSEDNLGENDIHFITYSANLYAQVRLVAARAGYLPNAKLVETEEGEYLYRLTLPFPHLWNLVRELRGMEPVESKSPLGQRRVDGGSLIQVARVTSAIYTGPVYDLSVGGEETSYLVNQVVVHNSPPGYKDSDREGYLTGKLRQRPQSVVLVDEIEKADPRLFDLFLQILDEGMLTDNKGNVIDCTGAAFFFTTNLGNDYVQQRRVGFELMEGKFGEDHEEYQGYVLESINEYFRLEMIARVNEVIVFHRLVKDGYLQIVDMEVAKIAQRLRACGNFRVHLTKSAKLAIVDDGASPEYGARGIADVLRDVLEDSIADYLLEEDLVGGVFRLRFSGSKGYQIELMDPKKVRTRGGREK